MFTRSGTLGLSPQLRSCQDRIDPDFSEELTLEVIERGSAVHCVRELGGLWPGDSTWLKARQMFE
jgi:hypothetical protein